MFAAIPYNVSDHYPVAVRWWKEHGLGEMTPVELLPTLGVVITFNEVPMSMVWIYRTVDCNVCWIAWPISDRYADKELRRESVDHLIRTAKEMSKQLGFEMLMTTSGHKSLQARLLKAGFHLGDENINSYAIRL